MDISLKYQKANKVFSESKKTTNYEYSSDVALFDNAYIMMAEYLNKTVISRAIRLSDFVSRTQVRA